MSDAAPAQPSNAAIGRRKQNEMNEHLLEEIQTVRNEWCRPSVVFRPKLRRDGNMYCALLGDNLQEGVCAFGASPDEAMRAFDAEWGKRIEGVNPKRELNKHE